MTQDDKDKIAGQTRREWRETKQEIAALREKAKRIGVFLETLSKSLQDCPERIVFKGQSFDGQFNPTSVIYEDGFFVEAGADNIRTIAEQLRKAIVQAGKLRKSLTELEGADPE